VDITGSSALCEPLLCLPDNGRDGVLSSLVRVRGHLALELKFPGWYAECTAVGTGTECCSECFQGEDDDLARGGAPDTGLLLQGLLLCPDLILEAGV
jgi:hypothetical protein